MQCADLLDKHVGSIAELPKQSCIAVVPPGLRSEAIATFNMIYAVTEVLRAMLGYFKTKTDSYDTCQLLVASTDGISSCHPRHPTCQLLSTSCQRQQGGTLSVSACCCEGATAANESSMALHIPSNASSATLSCARWVQPSALVHW
jgi:hypothetical protein